MYLAEEKETGALTLIPDSHRLELFLLGRDNREWNFYPVGNRLELRGNTSTQMIRNLEADEAT